MAAEFAAQLTRAAFAPLAAALGPYGDIALAATALAAARSEHGGLTDLFARFVERGP